MERAWKIEAMSIFGFWINPSFKSTLEIRTFLPSTKFWGGDARDSGDGWGSWSAGLVHPEIDKNSRTFTKKNK